MWHKEFVYVVIGIRKANYLFFFFYLFPVNTCDVFFSRVYFATKELTLIYKEEMHACNFIFLFILYHTDKPENKELPISIGSLYNFDPCKLSSINNVPPC